MTVTEQSLRAALAPASVPYLFYVTGKDGVTYFANDVGGARGEHPGSWSARGMTLNGETRITGLIGDPVAHSRSPAILNAAYREAGLELGLRRVPGAARARWRGGEGGRCARPRRSHRHDAAQGRRCVGVRRAHRRRQRPRRGERGDRARRRPARGIVDRRRGLPPLGARRGLRPRGDRRARGRRRRRGPGHRARARRRRGPGDRRRPSARRRRHRGRPRARWSRREPGRHRPGRVRARRQRHAPGDAGRTRTGPGGTSQPGPIGGRHRVPPYGNPVPRRRPRPRYPRRQRTRHARAPGHARVRALDRVRRAGRGHAYRRRPGHFARGHFDQRPRA